MSDPLSHEDLVRAKRHVSGVVDRLVDASEGELITTVVMAAGCAFLAACAAADIDPTDALDQLMDAEETGDLPEGVTTAFVNQTSH